MCVLAAMCALPPIASAVGFGAAQPRTGTTTRAGLPPPAEDRDLEDAYGAYERGDRRAAYAAYLRAAKRGQPIGEYNVAVMTFNGEGTRPDRTTALRWLTSSATQGFARAQYNIAMLYETGDGVYFDSRAWIVTFSD